jgi:hypothetical protein
MMVEFFQVADTPQNRDGLPKRGLTTPQCLCGRFAKFKGVTHYYNGNFDCARLTVECKRCGTIDIEIV